MAHEVDISQCQIDEQLEYSWDQNAKRVQARLVNRYLDLVVSTSSAPTKPGSVECTDALARAAAQIPESAFGLTHHAEKTKFIRRYQWLRNKAPNLELPDLDFLKAGDEISATLRLLCDGLTSFSELAKIDLVAYIKGLMGFNLSKQLDNLAPESLKLPDGTRKELSYIDDGSVVLTTRFERLFGLDETPEVAGQTVLLQLLAPNMRPVQMTQDLTSFWRETYPQIRKELRGRYPKHPWPENPLTALPGLHRQKKKRTPN